jgi:hypothetical protein
MNLRDPHQKIGTAMKRKAATSPNSFAIERSPVPETAITTVSTSSPATSSITAAARMVWLTRERTARKSMNTRAVMATLVAVMMAPKKRELF